MAHDSITRVSLSLNVHCTSKDDVVEGQHANPNTKLVIVMVGLPARGKSYITKKLARYLNWLQLETQIFNVGERRRAVASCPPQVSDDSKKTLSSRPRHSAIYFDPSNVKAVAQRHGIALATLKELLHWLQNQNGQVAILDATNSTIKRRSAIINEIERCGGDNVEVLFLESTCADESILEQNMRLKLQGPDYRTQDASTALDDFRQRVKMYEASYQTVGEWEEALAIPYVKLIDVGKKMIAFNTNGFLTTQTIEFLMNFHLTKRQIWLTRNGESDDDRFGRIGRHSPLSAGGIQYAQAMTKFILHCESEQSKQNNGSHAKAAGFKVWTSMMTQAMQTAQYFPSTQYTIRNSSLLNDLDAGSMAGLTFEEIRQQYPREMAAREADRMRYRWPGPGGEAYLDVIYRLRAVILELERVKDHMLLITHRAVIRVLVAYFQGLTRSDLTGSDPPSNTLYLVEPHPYGVLMKTFRYDPISQWFSEVSE